MIEYLIDIGQLDTSVQEEVQYEAHVKLLRHSAPSRFDNLWRLGKIIHGFNERLEEEALTTPGATGSVNAARLIGHDPFQDALLAGLFRRACCLPF